MERTTVLHGSWPQPAGRASGAALAAGLLWLAAIPLRAQQNIAWRYPADTDITYFTQSALGNIIVGAGRRLTSVNPATGKTEWTLSDSTSFSSKWIRALVYTPYLRVVDDAGNGLLDLQTGTWKWHAPAPTLASWHGLLTVPEARLMLEYVGGDVHGTLRAVDIETGDVKWQLDSVLKHAPEMSEVECCGNLKLRTVEGGEAPYFDGDSTLILWITEDGPLAVNVRSGAVLWHATSLAGKRAPEQRLGYAPIVASNGVAYLPYEKSLVAINVAGGGPTWREPRDYRSHVAQMRLVPEGLLVRTEIGPKDGGLIHKLALEVLDPKTGERLWKDAYTDLVQSTPFVLRGDTAFVSVDAHTFMGTHQKLVGISLGTGAAREVASFQFRGDEHPIGIQSRPGGIVLTSSQNVMMIDSAGLVRYQTYFPAPQASALARLAIGALVLAADVASYSMASAAAQAARSTMPYPIFNPLIDTRYKASVAMDRYMYVRTVVPDSTGNDIQGFIRVDKDTGKDNGRAAIGVKTGYIIDEVDGRVYYLANPREIVALRF